LGSVFETGGPFMYVVMALDVIGFFCVLLALVLAILGRRGTLPGAARGCASLVLLGCFLPLCSGVIGQTLESNQLEEDLIDVPASDREQIREHREAMAAYPFKFGGCSTLCCLLPAVVVMLVAPRRRENWEDVLAEEESA
jgi:hypothetical protein